MKNRILITSVFILLLSCKNEVNYTPYLMCNSNNTEEVSNLYTWQNQLVENDTVFVQAFFDTLKYVNTNIINTLSYTWVKDSIGKSFNWSEYIANEAYQISKEYKLIDTGFAIENGLEFSWFLVQSDESYSYLKYIKSNPIQVAILSTSADSSLMMDDLCQLNQLSHSAKSPILP